MNNFLIQSAALGVIALVAMYPSPERLRDAIKFDNRQTSLVASDEKSLIVDTPAHDEPTLVDAPFPLACATQDIQSSDLSGCASQLAAFIYGGPSFQTSVVSHGPDYEVANPEVEQARRALIEICRVQWSNQKVIDPAADEVCNSLF